MAQTDIASAQASDMTNVVKDVTVATATTEGAGEQKETRWNNSDWTKYWGYFSDIPDLKSAMLMKAAWIVGKGYTTDEATQVKLNNLHGWGKDTFEDIIFNMEVIKRVGGDAYAQIIRNQETGTLINLKPLDPGAMVHVVGADGLLLRYEQNSKVKGKKPKKFRPQEILHLSHNRLADQIHGISDIKACEETILADNESFEDVKKIMHRQARPMIMFKLGTDDTTKINAFVEKMDKAVNKGENIYIPSDKDSVDFEVIQVNVGTSVFEWRNDMRNRFYRTIGLPQIIPGASGQSTESESKAILAAYEVLVEIDQKKLERQLWEQLAVKLDFNPPGIMAEQLQTDERKDGNGMALTQPADTKVGVGR